MRLTRDWSWLSTSAIYNAVCITHYFQLCALLICPVHTPIRRRREGWVGESVGHVASPKDTHYCVLLYPPTEDYMEAKIEDTHKFPEQATPTKCLLKGGGTLESSQHTSTSDTSYLAALLSLNIGADQPQNPSTTCHLQTSRNSRVFITGSKNICAN